MFAYKRSRELARRMTCFRGELAGQVPPFPDGNEAAMKGVISPVPVDAPDLKYTPEDDEILKQWLRQFSM